MLLASGSMSATAGGGRAWVAGLRLHHFCYNVTDTVQQTQGSGPAPVVPRPRTAPPLAPPPGKHAWEPQPTLREPARSLNGLRLQRDCTGAGSRPGPGVAPPLRGGRVLPVSLSDPAGSLASWGLRSQPHTGGERPAPRTALQWPGGPGAARARRGGGAAGCRSPIRCRHLWGGAEEPLRLDWLARDPALSRCWSTRSGGKRSRFQI
jgi:hypothetical protein